MPGDQPKAQHFVQQKYLDAFCDPLPHNKTGAAVLWVHSADQPARLQIPKECAVENYFYCHEGDNGERSFLGENFLARLESASAEVLRAAQAGNLPRILRDRFTLTGYVAMSLVRTPSAKRLMDQAIIDNYVQQMRDVINDPIRHAAFCAEIEKETGERMEPEESKRALVGGKVRVTQTNRAWSLRQMAEMMMSFQEHLMGMRLLLLRANNGLFLTSDCPVAVHNPATRPILPPGFQSYEMVFPISRKYCLAGTYSVGPANLEIEADQVENLNRFLIRQADRFVYAPFDAHYIQPELQNSLADKAAKKRDDALQLL